MVTERRWQRKPVPILRRLSHGAVSRARTAPLRSRLGIGRLLTSRDSCEVSCVGKTRRDESRRGRHECPRHESNPTTRAVLHSSFMNVSELDTPALLIDLDVFERNL